MVNVTRRFPALTAQCRHGVKRGHADKLGRKKWWYAASPRIVAPSAVFSFLPIQRFLNLLFAQLVHLTPELDCSPTQFLVGYLAKLIQVRPALLIRIL